MERVLLQGDPFVAFVRLFQQVLPQLLRRVATPEAQVVSYEQAKHSIVIAVLKDATMPHQQIAMRLNLPAGTKQPTGQIIFFNVVIVIDRVSTDCQEGLSTNRSSAIEEDPRYAAGIMSMRRIGQSNTAGDGTEVRSFIKATDDTINRSRLGPTVIVEHEEQATARGDGGQVACSASKVCTRPNPADAWKINLQGLGPVG